MPRPVGNVTEIDIGIPPYAPDRWETFKLNFHGFEALPTEKGVSVETSKFSCFGQEWWLELYPGGHGGSKDDMVAIFLFSNMDGIAVKYRISIYDMDDNRISSCFDMDKSDFPLGLGLLDFIERSKIVDPTDNILIDGTLVVEVKLMLRERTTLPCRPFVPENPFIKNMQELYYQDEKYCDVAFVFPQETVNSSDDDESKIENQDDEGDNDGENNEDDDKDEIILYAHRAILQICAPCLFELCEPYEKSNPLPLTNVKYEIFELLLQYVYGKTITVADWKEHSKELIEAADLYGVSSLKLEAEAWYVKFTKITAENVMDLLLYSDAKNCALLKEGVMDYFVENGKESLESLSFDQIPESRSLFTDLLLATTGREKGSDADIYESDDDTNKSSKCKSMRVCSLRRELHKRGLDVDGSREVLVKRLRREDV